MYVFDFRLVHFCNNSLPGKMKIHQILPFVLLLLMSSAAIRAEQSAPADSAKPASAEVGDKDVRAKIEALNKRQGLDEALKTKVLAIYQEAEENLTQGDKHAAQAAAFGAALKTAPQQTRRLREEVAASQRRADKPKGEDWSAIPTEELEQRLIIEKSKAASLDDQIKDKETALLLQNNRPEAIREELAAAKQALDAARDQLASTQADASSPLESEARLLALKTRIARLAEELKMLDAEALSNPMRIELLKAELQWLEVQRGERDPIIESIDEQLADRRQQEAQRLQDALSQAEKELSGKHVLIQQVTRQNLQYTRDLQEINGKNEKFTEQKNSLDAFAAAIDNDFKSAEKKIDLAGLSPALGKILREQRRILANQERYLPRPGSLQDETSAASLAQFNVDDELQQLANVDTALKGLMRSGVDPNWPLEQRMMVQAELRVLLNSKKELLSRLSESYAAFLHTLGDYDFARRQLVSEIEVFATFLDERLLWVPSSEPLNLSFFTGLYVSTQWLLSPANWLGAAGDLLDAALARPFGTLLAALLLGFAQLARMRIKPWLAGALEKADKVYADSFINSLAALMFAMLLALPSTGLIYGLGWLLEGNWQSADFSKAVGAGLKTASVPLLLLQFFYRLFEADGIAVKHFQWQKDNALLLRRHFAWMRFVSVPCAFLVYCAGASKSAVHGDSLGRLALLALMTAMAVFFGRVLNPRSGLLKSHMQLYPLGWVSRLRYCWYPAVYLPPLIVIGFAAAGYYLSAVELQQKLIETLRLAFGLIVVRELVIRWLTLANRQLAIQNARQKRRAAMLGEKTVAGDEDPLVLGGEHLVDIPKINAQTIKLTNVLLAFGALAGAGIIWRNILPAFSFLERIVLWKHLDVVDNQEVLLPVTLANILLAGFYIFMTVVAVRNFSGVMELLVFRRLPVEAGGRYAVNQLATYVLIAAGFLAVANELGGKWADVQWLVAALGVGLGFGLQEIFANFVSGIILLFERPVRVGDTVTIGDVTGKVSRIQMRATTLIDWDQKEMIVPNKTFITSHLVNWSLSDAITRVVIPLGIAYGSNVEQAHRVLLETVKSTPLVLAEPEPSVLFIGFGESSLNFSIRIFVSELSHRLQATHNIHLRLERAMREHGIVIPFPQRDVHIRAPGSGDGRGDEGREYETVA